MDFALTVIVLAGVAVMCGIALYRTLTGKTKGGCGCHCGAGHCLGGEGASDSCSQRQGCGLGDIGELKGSGDFKRSDELERDGLPEK